MLRDSFSGMREDDVAEEFLERYEDEVSQVKTGMGNKEFRVKSGEFRCNRILSEKDININGSIVIAIGGAIVNFSLGEFSSMTGRSKFIEGEVGLADHDRIDKVGSIKSSGGRMVSGRRFYASTKGLDKRCRTSDIVFGMDIGT